MTQQTVCIVGLGYVGLPLAHAVSKAGHNVYGYDVNIERIHALQQGKDATGELSSQQMNEVQITYSDDPVVLENADIIIMAIPTPVDDKHKPDLSLVEKASATVGKHMKHGAIVVYESTVYPGVTEELCGTILEKESGKICGQDFFLGYSPERINPGDKQHTVDKIIKVVAGQNEKTTDTLCEFYESFVTAGVHRAPNIKVAEMAKAIENAQRDLNIAFVNEVAVLAHHIGISSKDVLDAAKTKWNFLPFSPGLVGGHCIGVDPYYLVEKAKQLGVDTKVITAGRSTNDNMGKFVAKQIHEALEMPSRILVLGLTFKENVPDTRNAKSHDVIEAIIAHGHTVDTHDATLTNDMPTGEYDAVALLVPHKAYADNTEAIVQLCKNGGVIYDLKSVLDKAVITKNNFKYLAL